MLPTPQWPSEDDGRRIYAELMSVSTLCAQNEFAVAYLQPVCDFLAREFSHTPEDVRHTAATEAVLNVIRHPERYDPTRLPIAAYLRMAARRDMLTLLARDGRRRAREIPLATVEEPSTGQNKRVEQADELVWSDPRIVAVVDSFTPSERITFELLRVGERQTHAYARALGWDEERPDLEVAVKRVKDRVKVRLVRAVGGRA
ncbi:Uncharacterized protein OS=Roseiflexus sp. (strain RS-1) GN=RoseRS_2252 PE=4 SV=1 [Gemmata massiliana]|uniref:RNA polymerase sigma-70 region 2 domain-containing protein n=1 Tax=Gemmata massiliana TaxID=1210884 RepID=A0A6P2CWS0_9BACT|nr:sigma-70 family RNA polymerase sigma factor [Gemmata massiliana]VTR93588.1 Uncharacterized protein OS=Roseiflexus sp. (strain RS-1) GN=RoseRS_2252 PE=4 SV=1 [Gemmata massiliana]